MLYSRKFVEIPYALVYVSWLQTIILGAAALNRVQVYLR